MFRSKKVSSPYGFAKGSRGGTWHVPRGTWRHVTNAIVVPAPWRIEWCLSHQDRLRRSGAINQSPWTYRHTHKQHWANVNFDPIRNKSSFLRMDFVHSSSLRFWTRGRRILIALGFKIETFYFPKILTPLILGGQKILWGWIARVKVPPCAKFGDPSSKGLGARGQKAEMQKCALRAHFCTPGAVRPHGTQVRPRPLWPESLGSRPPPV